MSLMVFAFPRQAARTSDWSNAELAELYRVQHALGQAGIPHEVDRGVTDEGDPWFTFGLPDGEVLVHITRYDGLYRLHAAVLPDPLTGTSFQALTKAFVGKIPTPAKQTKDSSVVIHPSALLGLIIASIFFACDFLSPQSAKAAESNETASKTKPGDAQVAHAQADLQLAKALLARINQSPSQDDLSQWLTLQAVIIVAAIGFAPNAMIITPAISGERLADQIELASFSVAALIDDYLQNANVNTRLASLSHLDGRNVPSSDAIRLYLTNASNETVQRDASVASNVVFNSLSIPDFSSNKPTQQVFADLDLVLVTSKILSLRANTSGLRQVIDARQAGQFIALEGQVNAQIVGLSEFGNPLIILVGSKHRLELKFEKLSNFLQVEQAIALWDSAHLTLDNMVFENNSNFIDSNIISKKPFSTSSKMLDVLLNVSSQGQSANSLLLSDQLSLPGALNINLYGNADLSIYEKASLFQRTSVDGRSFAGYLTFAVDLGGDNSTYEILDVGASNYNVTPKNSLALLNLPNNIMVNVAIDLNKFILAFSGETKGLMASATINLSNEVSVNSIETKNVPQLQILSGLQGQNKINLIKDLDLWRLTLRGAADVQINHLESDKNNSLIIDSRDLQGTLIIDLTNFDVADNRLVIIEPGSSDTFVQDLKIEDRLSFYSSNGSRSITIGPGDLNDTIFNLKIGDKIAINGSTETSSLYDLSELDYVMQSRIDSQKNIILAAEVSSAMCNSPGEHQVIIFKYKFETFAFIDSEGSHLFNSNSDAIVKLIGFSDAYNLGSVFWS